MKNLIVKRGLLLVVFAFLFSITSLLYADSTIKMDTILTDKASDDFSSPAKDVFTPDTPVIYVLWKSDQVKEGQKIRTVWIADDTNNVAPPNYKIDEASFDLNKDFKDKMMSALPGSYWGGTASVSKPNTGWPVGKYHVEMYVDSTLVKSISFTVAANTQAQPEPKNNSEDTSADTSQQSTDSDQ